MLHFLSPLQLNTGSITHGPAGNDLNVEPAWMQGITGSGVVVGIVDNGNQDSASRV